MFVVSEYPVSKQKYEQNPKMQKEKVENVLFDNIY